MDGREAGSTNRADFFCIVVSVIIIVMLYMTILRGYYFRMRKNNYCLVISIVNYESKVKRNVTDQVSSSLQHRTRMKHLPPAR